MKSLLNSYYLITRKKIPTYLKYYLARRGIEPEGLPDEYQRVSYLESSGTQYIDTGVIPDKDLELGVELQLIELIARRYILGAYASNIQYYLYTTDSYWQFGWNCTYFTTEAAVDTNKHLIKMYSDSEKSCLEIDGVVVSERPSGNHISNSPLPIFCGRAGSMQSGVPQRIYSFYLKNHSTGEVIQNLIPCYRKSGNKPGMYDTVNNEFLVNLNTQADFTVGPDVN